MNPETHASLQALEKELERLRSAVEHIDQAKAMGNALSQAQIRMYGGGSDGTVDTIRNMFTSGFSLRVQHRPIMRWKS